ncbi:MAG: YlxM family DNA-binding protein [Ruminococcus sp.]|nr:YlxM family DNA-binding protein [Ruminococcus sp.]
MAKELEFVMLLDCYGELLTEKQRNIMELYYCEDLSLGEIGVNLSITRQAVRSIIKRAEILLADYEQKLGFVQRLKKMRRCFDDISSTAGKITDENIKNTIESRIKNALDLL